MPSGASVAYDVPHAPTPVATPTASGGTGNAALAREASLPQPMPVLQWTTLFTVPAVEGASSTPTVSAIFLPTFAGAGASSKPSREVENSHCGKGSFEPSLRARWYRTRSIASVANAPAATPLSVSRTIPMRRTLRDRRGEVRCRAVGGYLSAVGFTIEPVPLVIGSGVAFRRN